MTRCSRFSRLRKVLEVARKTLGLAMKARDKHRLAENVTIHRIDDRSAGGRRFLRRALRHVEFDVERVQLERVVVIRTRWCARTHVSVPAETHLTAAVRKLALGD